MILTGLDLNKITLEFICQKFEFENLLKFATRIRAARIKITVDHLTFPHSLGLTDGNIGKTKSILIGKTNYNFHYNRHMEFLNKLWISYDCEIAD